MVVLSALSCAGLAFPEAVRAHALPVGIALQWPDSAATTQPWVLTSRGVVFSQQEGAALRCNEAFSVNTSALPQLWVQGDSLTLATPYGVLRSRDRGCTVTEAAGLPDVALGGFAVLADAQQTMLVSTGQSHPMGGVFASVDHGQSFLLRHANASAEAFTVLVAAPDAPARVYASGFVLDAALRKVTFLWARSDDGGLTFTRTPLERERVLLGVLPGHADMVFAYERLSDLTEEVSLLRSVDGGLTFAESARLHGRPVLAASPSGDALWVGASATPGLLHSVDLGGTFAGQHPELLAVTCLAHQRGALHVCGQLFPIELGVWSAASAEAPLAPVLRFSDVTTPVACGAGPDICTASWQDWSAELLSERVGSDAGTPLDAGSGMLDAGQPQPRAAQAGTHDSGAVSSPAPASSGGGCQVTQSADSQVGATVPGLVTAVLALLGLASRRGRRLSAGSQRVAPA